MEVAFKHKFIEIVVLFFPIIADIAKMRKNNTMDLF